MNLSKRQLAILALIVNNIIWGAAPPILKWSLVDIPPFTLAFLRFFLACLLIFPFICKSPSIKRKDYGKFFILALCGIVINISFFFFGLQKAPSINVSIIGSATPVLLILGGIFFLREKPNVKIILGTLMSLIGVIVIIIRPLLEHAPDHAIIGNLFFVVSTIGLTTYMILLKKYDLSYPSLTIVFYVFLLSSIMFFPFFMFEMKTIHVNLFSLRSLVGIGYSAIGSSALAYTLLAYGEKSIKASEIGLFTYMDPIITALVALPLLNETITFSFLLGSVFVFFGIFIAEGRIHYHPFHLLKSSVKDPLERSRYKTLN